MIVVATAIVFLMVRSSYQHELVDLGYSFDPTTLGWPQEKPFKMVVTHNGTSEFSKWLQTEEIAQGTHWGTHMDAPCHMALGRWTVEDIPLGRLFDVPAAVVDMADRAKADRDALLQVWDLEGWERTNGRTVDGHLVMVRTGWSKRWPDRKEYLGNADNDVDNLHFPGVSEEAARWLVTQRRIFGLGIESLSLDSGLNMRLRELGAHRNLLGNNVYGLENVNGNLEKLPGCGATITVLPMKIKDACGAPVRIVARLPDISI